MKLYSNQYVMPAILSILFLLWGCKQPETIVVDRSPTAVADTTNVPSPDTSDASFRKLAMGEYQPIRSLDPLFADNASAMRTVQLIYEGLVRLNTKGTVVPGLAQNWKVSNDSLSYTFKLRSDIYYHDNDAFSTGIGRKLIAEDVRFVFERMAKSHIPPTAAQLFMNIRGFNSYYQEQRLVYNPEERNLDGISGIQTPDERTVIFELEQPDPNFLQKLATPLAVIYPKEAVGETVAGFTAVGTGPFTFSQRQADSTLILSKFQNYYGASNIRINRIDINVSTSESELLQAMDEGEIHLLPQLGPRLMQRMLNDRGTLVESYRQRYRLRQAGGNTEYRLRHNPAADLSSRAAQAIGNLLASDTLSYFDTFPANLVTGKSVDTTQTSLSISEIKTPIYSVYTDDPFARTFIDALSQTLGKADITLQMRKIRAPSQNTALLVTQHYPAIPNNRWDDYPPLFRFSVEHLAVQRTEIDGLNFNRHPWWFDIRGVTLPAVEQLN